MEEDKTFIELGTLIIAIIALLQPWLLFIYKKYLKRGKVVFFETGNIEIGFSNYASTIGISGTLRSLNTDFFVSKISLELTKDRDSSKHNFEWSIFRDTKISLVGDGQTHIELPYGILLTTQSPQRLSIQFHDNKQQDDIRPIHEELANKWQSFLDANFPYDQRRIANNLDNHIYSVFEEFNKSCDITDAYAKFNRNFYWDAGTYSINFNIQTSQPDKIFSKKYKFSLNEEQCKNLRLNVITLNDHACEQTRYNWNFAFTNFI